MTLPARILQHLSTHGPDENKRMAAAMGETYKAVNNATRAMADRGEITFEMAEGLRGQKKRVFTINPTVKVAAAPISVHEALNDLQRAWG